MFRDQILNQHVKIAHATKRVTFEQTAHWDRLNVPRFGISDHQLQVLAYLTHVVTLSFLYFAEVNPQNGLLEIFPRLFNDLKRGASDALKEYRVEYPHVQVTQPTTNVAQQLLEKMCEVAATVLEQQTWKGLCDTNSNAIASALTRRWC